MLHLLKHLVCFRSPRLSSCRLLVLISRSDAEEDDPAIRRVDILLPSESPDSPRLSDSRSVDTRPSVMTFPRCLLPVCFSILSCFVDDWPLPQSVPGAGVGKTLSVVLVLAQRLLFAPLIRMPHAHTVGSMSQRLGNDNLRHRRYFGVESPDRLQTKKSCCIGLLLLYLATSHSHMYEQPNLPTGCIDMCGVL